MLLLAAVALAAENPVRASHGTVAAGGALGVVSLAALSAHSGPRLDGQDVLAVHSGAVLLGTLGGAMVVGGEGRAGNALRERGLTVPKGAWYTSLGGLVAGAAGGACVLATQRRVVTEWGGYTEGAPLGCAALYVVGMGTSYTAGVVQAMVDDAAVGRSAGDTDEAAPDADEDAPDADEAAPDRDDDADPDRGLDLRWGASWGVDGPTLLVTGRF